MLRCQYFHEHFSEGTGFHVGWNESDHSCTLATSHTLWIPYIFNNARVFIFLTQYPRVVRKLLIGTSSRFRVHTSEMYIGIGWTSQYFLQLPRQVWSTVNHCIGTSTMQASLQMCSCYMSNLVRFGNRYVRVFRFHDWLPCYRRELLRLSLR